MTKLVKYLVIGGSSTAVAGGAAAGVGVAVTNKKNNENTKVQVAQSAQIKTESQQNIPLNISDIESKVAAFVAQRNAEFHQQELSRIESLVRKYVVKENEKNAQIEQIQIESAENELNDQIKEQDKEAMLEYDREEKNAAENGVAWNHRASELAKQAEATWELKKELATFNAATLTSHTYNKEAEMGMTALALRGQAIADDELNTRMLAISNEVKQQIVDRQKEAEMIQFAQDKNAERARIYAELRHGALKNQKQAFAVANTQAINDATVIAQAHSYNKEAEMEMTALALLEQGDSDNRFNAHMLEISNEVKQQIADRQKEAEMIQFAQDKNAERARIYAELRHGALKNQKQAFAAANTQAINEATAVAQAHSYNKEAEMEMTNLALKGQAVIDAEFNAHMLEISNEVKQQIADRQKEAEMIRFAQEKNAERERTPYSYNKEAEMGMTALALAYQADFENEQNARMLELSNEVKQQIADRQVEERMIAWAQEMNAKRISSELKTTEDAKKLYRSISSEISDISKEIDELSKQAIEKDGEANQAIIRGLDTWNIQAIKSQAQDLRNQIDEKTTTLNILKEEIRNFEK